MAEFTLGTNYWPRKKAMYWWKDFNRAEVEAEFAQIATLGLHVVRFFLLWEDFQPTPDTINDANLANLGVVLDAARNAGILAMPTFFTGHMSGVNWWPIWALLDEEDETGMRRVANGQLTWRKGRDPYTDPLMLDAETRLIEAVCGRYGNHPAIYAWNLSNEPDLFYQPAQYADSAGWNQLHATHIRRLSPHRVSAGVHMPTIASYNGFRPDGLAPHNDYLTMHGYSIYYHLTEVSDPLNSDVVPIACLITEALGGKPVLFEEFGYASSEHGDWSGHIMVDAGRRRQYLADDSSGGIYYRDVLTKLARCGALGAFGWMFTDYDKSLWHLPPLNTHEHERFFGLTRVDGSIKPSGEAMRLFNQRIVSGDLPNRQYRPLRLDAQVWYQDPAANFDRVFKELRGTL